MFQWKPVTSEGKQNNGKIIAPSLSLALIGSFVKTVNANLNPGKGIEEGGGEGGGGGGGMGRG